MSGQTEIIWGEEVQLAEASEWPTVTFDDVVLINPSEKMPKGTQAKKVVMDKIHPFTKKIKGYEIEGYSGGTKFRNGDTLLARITPCLENGKTAFVDFLGEHEVAFGSTEYIVIRERDGVTDKQFLYYLAISPDFRDMAIQGMTGSSGRQRVETDVIKNYQLELPPFLNNAPSRTSLGAWMIKLNCCISKMSPLNH
jgi:type I restriction enzyme S subunit